MISLFDVERTLSSVWRNFDYSNVFVSIIALYIFQKVLQAIYNITLHPLRNVPGPRLARMSSLWAGHYQRKLKMADAIKDAHEHYGPVIRISPNQVHFASPSALKEIYSQSKTAPKKSRFYVGARIFDHDNIFSFINKESHKSRKKLMSRCFSPDQSLQFAVGVRKLCADLCNQVSRNMTNHEKTMDLFHWMEWFTFEAMYLLCFDRPAGMIESGVMHPVMVDMEASKAAFPWASILPILLSYGHLLPISAIAESFQAKRRFKEFAVEALSKANENPKRTVFMARLLDTEDESLGRALTNSEAAEEIVGILMAGSGTTAITLVYLFYELAKEKEIQEQLFQELLIAMPNRDEVPDHKAVSSLPLLLGVINETLRLHPSIVGILPRETVTQQTINGISIPKGTVIGMSNPIHQVDPAIYTSPGEWIPKRWLVDDLTQLKSAFTPFGIGPRNCIGQQLSIVEMQLLIATLCRRYTFELSPAQKLADMNPIDTFNAAPACHKLELIINERLA